MFCLCVIDSLAFVRQSEGLFIWKIKNLYISCHEKGIKPSDFRMPSVRHGEEKLQEEKKGEVRARLELATFCVWSRRDNHYTIEPSIQVVLICKPIMALVPRHRTKFPVRFFHNSSKITWEKMSSSLEFLFFSSHKKPDFTIALHSFSKRHALATTVKSDNGVETGSSW